MEWSRNKQDNKKFHIDQWSQKDFQFEIHYEDALRARFPVKQSVSTGKRVWKEWLKLIMSANLVAKSNFILVFTHAQIYKHNWNSNLWSSLQQHITLTIWTTPVWLEDQHLNWSEIQLSNHLHEYFLVYSQKPQQCVNCQDISSYHF